MAVRVVGLSIELILKQFAKQKKIYERGLKDMEKQTKQTADAVSRSSQQMTASLKQVTPAMDDLSRRSAEMGAAAMTGAEQLRAMGFALDPRRMSASSVAIGETTRQIEGTKEALRQASDEAASTGGIFSQLGVSITGVAFAAGVAATAVGAWIKIVKDSISDFEDYNEQIRRLNLGFGISVEEAGRWVRAAQLSGVSALVLSRSFSQAGKQLTDYYTNLKLGKTTSTTFSRALTALSISVTDQNGKMRDSTEVISEVNEKLRELGPSWITAGIARDIYGRGAEQLLPLILDETIALEDLRGGLEEDQVLHEELRRAKVRLAEATKQAKDVIAREYIPVWARVVDAIASVIEWLGKLDEKMRGSQKQTIAHGVVMGSWIDFLIKGKKAREDLTTTADEAKAKEEELTEARQKAAQEAAALRLEEAGLAEEREKVLQKLVALTEQWGERAVAIQERFAQREEDLWIRRNRQLLDQAIRLYEQLEELADRYEQRRQKVIDKTSSRIRDIQRDRDRQVQKAEEDGRKRREKLEERHRFKLWQIQQRYLAAIDEAVRSNDAVAVLRAIRRRNQQIKEAKKRHEMERGELDDSIKDRQKQIRDDAAERIRREKEKQKEQLDELKRQYEQQRAELKDQLEQVLSLLDEEYKREFEKLKDSKTRERDLTLLHWRWQQEDLDRAKRRQVDALVAWYKKEREELGAHLDLTQGEIDRAIRDTTQIVKTGVTEGIADIAGAAQRQIEAVGRGMLYGAGQRITAGVTRRRGGAARAEGGIDIVSRPTTFIAGEAGPEMAAFIPLRHSVNVKHNFSRLGIDVNGMRGLNTAQAENMINTAMKVIAEQMYARM